ncbi:MAG: hypothetical protein QW622_01580 [Candidatus Pacearchaeota archaeon]
MISDKLFTIGISLIIIGIIIVFIASLSSLFGKKTKTEVGFGGFIGPIPFGVFSSKQAFWIWLALFLLFIFILIIFIIINKFIFK